MCGALLLTLRPTNMRLLAILLLAILPTFGQVPTVIPTASVANKPTYTPQWVGSAGAGATVPGNGKFAYYSISTFIGQNTYATIANEYTITSKGVQTCSLAGITKDMYEFGHFDAGVTGLGGGCINSNTSAGPTAQVQGFLNYHIKQSHYSITTTARKFLLDNGNTSIKVTLGVTYGY